MKTIYTAACMLLSFVGLAQPSAPLSNNPPGTIIAQPQPDAARPSRPQQPDPGARPSPPQQSDPGARPSPPQQLTDGARPSRPQQPAQFTYSFTVTNTAEYEIQTLVRTSGPLASSILVNIDAPPHEPEMLWDIPPTTNFQSRFVTWRGTNAQPEHKYFSVAPGDHVLFFQPCSPGVQLQTVTLQPRSQQQRPEAPTGLRIESASPPPPPTNLRVVAH